MFIIFRFSLGDMPSGHLFLCQLYFFPYSRLSSYLLLFLCLFSFLQFPFASVWENTRARVDRFL